MTNKISILKIISLAAALFSAAPVCAAQEEPMTDTPKTLIVYFSHSGNTKRIADKIAAAVPADVARIETLVPYTGSMNEVSAQGKREVESGYKPEIKPLNVNPSDYDRIVIGTPTWWYTMVPAVATFFASTDLSGKDVVLYMTNAGWPGHVISDMSKAAKGARVISTKEILFASDGGNRMVTPEKEIDDWISEWK